jgi:hypothetical protein
MFNLIKGDLVNLKLYLYLFFFYFFSYIKDIKGDRYNIN